MLIFAPHKTNPEKLESVKKEMQKRGAPTIRAYYIDAWYAIEGSHRIAAAHDLGLTPIIKQVYMSSNVKNDFQDLPSPCKVSKIAEFINHQVSYDFEDA